MKIILETNDLKPIDGRKSFYGKAKVIRYDDGSEDLISYGTKVLSKRKDGTIIKRWDGLSQTTLRHIKAYCICLNLTKKEWQDMEVVPES